ncbi:DUF4097 family beta strand repeat-containing protein [Actinomadura violacea]|uniref:DUF4097 family beta strand repeat protein n=1 Tax=Actinomadura violacea TaxID=2819934 RepID=A0ABS3RNJ2_9ACTN|nr:DUF4097 family beta strand repeat-containing protein [Actinomadura violacea]MBO2458324.1 DUF4097 family beta strand repeat protein [Actinomadura violacea]
MGPRTTLAASAAVAALAALATGCADDFGPATNHAKDSATVTGAAPVVDIHNGSGSVRIVAGAGPVKVHRTMDYHHTRPGPIPRTAGSDGTLRLAADCDGCKIGYELTVPPATQVRVHGGSGRVDVSGVAQVRYDGGSGTVGVTRVTGPVQVRTGSGSVDVSHVGAAVTIRAASGDIGLADVGGAVVAVTSHGDLHASGLRAPSVEGRIGSGSLKLDFATAPQRVTAQSGSGNIEIRLPSQGYRIEAAAGSGSVHRRVPDSPAATALISAHSGSGDIDIDGR